MPPVRCALVRAPRSCPHDAVRDGQIGSGPVRTAWRDGCRSAGQVAVRGLPRPALGREEHPRGTTPPRCARPRRARRLSTMSRKPIAPAWERGDGLLVRGVEHGGEGLASLADLLRRRTAPNASSSSGSNVHVLAVRPVEWHADAGTRSGQPRPSAIGSRMFGRGRLRDGRPVDELDHRVHDRLRVHRDVDAVVRHVEEQVRLDHLEALVDQGGELVVTRWPMSHVGGRAPVLAWTSASSARVRPRNGPPDAVSTRRRTSSALPDGAERLPRSRSARCPPARSVPVLRHAARAARRR